MASVLGIRVDDRRRELWAVSNNLGRKQERTITGLFRFRLADGSLIRSYPLDSDGRHGLNDLIVASDGSVYATATDGSTVVRLDPKTGVYEDVLPAGAVPDANGITISDNEHYLFVAGWYSITRIDLSTRKAIILRKPDAIADGCNDGLYFHSARSLIGIQNCVHATGRVMRYNLSPDLESIEGAQVLESYNPRFNGITTGAIVGDQLFFIANPQLRKIGPHGHPLSRLDPLQVLRLPLN
jgi:sugar lactone lactonase YvrE